MTEVSINLSNLILVYDMGSVLFLLYNKMKSIPNLGDINEQKGFIVKIL